MFSLSVSIDSPTILSDAFTMALKQIKQSTDAIRLFISALVSFAKEKMKRAYHLLKHSKKRTRKKNLSRIVREMKRQGCDNVS